MPTPTKNTGVLLGRRVQDYVAGTGSALPYVINNPTANWDLYLPSPEKQWGGNGDKMNCVTQSYDNMVETELNEMIKNKKLPVSHLDFLWQYGYLDENGLVNFNDRVSSILNDTTQQGNWLYIVADKAREFGLFPYKIINDDVNMTWAEYYDKSVVTPEVLEVGKKFKQYFSLGYQFLNLSIANLQYYLKQAPIQVVYPHHAVENFYQEADLTHYFDTYDPYKKTMPFGNFVDALMATINPLEIPMTNALLVKMKNEHGVYGYGFWMPVHNESGLISQGLNFGVPIPTTPDNKVNWVETEKLCKGEIVPK